MRPDAVDRAKLWPKSGVGVGHWFVIAAERNPVIAIDLRMLDGLRVATRADGTFEWPARRPDPKCHVMLVSDELEVALFILDGRSAVRDLVAAGTPVIGSTMGDADALVFIDGRPIKRRERILDIGARSFRFDDVKEYARLGGNIPLAEGGLIQAGTAMLVIAAAERGDRAPNISVADKPRGSA